MNKNKLKNDILLVLSILSIGTFIFGILRFTSKKGSYVNVIIAGNYSERYSLKEDLEKELVGYNGGTNLLVIKDGKAYIKSASCPDKICQNHRAISKSNETIVCLPNKIVIGIE